jgi:hypothetical protein
LYYYTTKAVRYGSVYKQGRVKLYEHHANTTSDASHTILQYYIAI